MMSILKVIFPLFGVIVFSKFQQNHKLMIPRKLHDSCDCIAYVKDSQSTLPHFHKLDTDTDLFIWALFKKNMMKNVKLSNKKKYGKKKIYYKNKPQMN